MKDRGRAAHAAMEEIVAGLAKPRRLLGHGPKIARIILAIRLQALYERQCEDPLPDLAVRLESVTLAGLVLEYTTQAKRIWPEPIHVGRMCCQCLSHDEGTLAAMLAAAADGDRDEFDRELEGLVKVGRRAAIWDIAVRISAWL